MTWKQKDLDRFDSKVDTTAIDGCHPWTASTTLDGYGLFRLNGKLELAHRFSNTINNYPIPEGMLVRHGINCTTPSCVNPAHLTTGTHADNMRDRDLAGRTPRGESCGASKLKKKQVVEIRQRAAAGESVKEITSDYPVTSESIRSVINRTTWNHV